MLRTLFRAVILLAAAGGLCIAFAHAAAADVVPHSTSQPAQTTLFSKGAVSQTLGLAKLESAAAKSAIAASEKGGEAVAKSPETRPAAGQAFRASEGTSGHIARPASTSVMQRILDPLRAGVQRVEAVLGKVVGVCAVGFGTGNGGPILVLAFLGLALPLTRRRAMGSRLTTNEGVHDFLYAWEVTPPG